MAMDVVNKKISYGFIELPELDNGDYEIQVTMSGKRDMATGFKVTLYSLEQKLNFHDEYWVLSEHLRAAIQRKDSKL